jgi:hypothetical protein
VKNRVENVEIVQVNESKIAANRMHRTHVVPVISTSK